MFRRTVLGIGMASVVLALGWSATPAVASGPPTVETETGRGEGGTSATLHGTVNPNGSEVTECNFEYGSTVSYGSSVPCSMLPGLGEKPVPVSGSISGLQPCTIYHFRLVATNSNGTSFGQDEVFKTGSCPPAAVVEAPSPVGITTATLRGTVNPQHLMVSECNFEYGTSLSYGTNATCAPNPTNQGETKVSASVTGLTEGTIYHVRVTIVTTAGTAHSSDLIFKTAFPAYYVNGSRAGSEPIPVISWGTLTFRTVLGGSGEVTCHTVAGGMIENAAGGPSIGSTGTFAAYDCESGSCPTGASAVQAESLPWSSTLVLVGGVARTRSARVKLSVECQAEAGPMVANFTGTLEPRWGHGMSALHPGFLDFDEGSGTLEREGSKGAVLEKLEGQAKVLGYEEQELINAK